MNFAAYKFPKHRLEIIQLLLLHSYYRYVKLVTTYDLDKINYIASYYNLL